MHKNKYFPLLLITPFIIFFVLFRLLPILFTAITSVVDFNNSDMNLVFFDNIKSMINDNIFWKSIINTLLIFIFYIIIKFLFIFFIANLLEDVRRKRLVLLFLYLPTLVGLFAYAIIFKYVFTYQGVINNFIEIYPFNKYLMSKAVAKNAERQQVLPNLPPNQERGSPISLTASLRELIFGPAKHTNQDDVYYLYTACTHGRGSL